MFKFKKERDLDNSFDTSEVILKSYSNILPDILEDFEGFLRACGFVFDGTIEIVPNIEDEESGHDE